jgi:hypothetical protein
MSIASKRYTFTPPTRVISVNDAVGDADFVGEPLPSAVTGHS